MTTAPHLPLFWVPYPKSKLLGEIIPADETADLLNTD